MAARARSESPLRRAYAEALKTPAILGYMATSGLNFSCMFAWIAAAPYLVIGVYHVPPIYFGWVFGANAAGFMAASQVNRRLLKRVSGRRHHDLGGHRGADRGRRDPGRRPHWLRRGAGRFRPALPGRLVAGPGLDQRHGRRPGGGSLTLRHGLGPVRRQPASPSPA